MKIPKTIRVHEPFDFRPGLGAPVRSFGRGTHTLTETEAEHPFIQGCIAAGRADVVAEAPEPEVPEPEKPEPEAPEPEAPEPEKPEPEKAPEPTRTTTRKK